MIIVKLQGGLGNQMFQYALGRRVQSQTKKRMVLDISDYKYDDQREYSLNNFILNNDVEIDDSGKYNWIYDGRKNKIIKLLYKLCPNISFNMFSKFGVYIWDFARYKELDINKSIKNIYLHGFWHSDKYFKKSEKILKNELKITKDIANRNLYYEILNNNSVCVHIRRGDFLLSTNKLKVCSNEYFKNAMNIMSQKINKPKFFIFSDDIEDIKKNFEFDDFDIRFVEEKNKDYEELKLMYSCKSYIISNSTFSWWAQYLSDAENKVVIAPSEWYEDQRENDLLDDKWITIEP